MTGEQCMHGPQAEVAAHECELERSAITPHAQRDAAAGAAEDAPERLVEGKGRRRGAIDGEDGVARLDAGDAGRPVDCPPDEKAARGREDEHTDSAVAADVGAARSAEFG